MIVILLQYSCDNSFNVRISDNLIKGTDTPFFSLSALGDSILKSKNVSLKLFIASEDNNSIFGDNYKTKDKIKISQFFKNNIFKMEGGDVATLKSFITLKINDKISFHANIVISDSLYGIQNSQFGYCSLLNKSSKRDFIELFK